MTHHLKIHPGFFEAVENGRKTFEVRSVVDRDFQFYDTLVLEEWNPFAYFPRPNDPEEDARRKQAAYTGRKVTRLVTYVLHGITYNGEPAVVLALGMPREAES